MCNVYAVVKQERRRRNDARISNFRRKTDEKKQLFMGYIRGKEDVF